MSFFYSMYETGSSTSWTRSSISGDWGSGTGFIGVALRTLDASTGHPVISLDSLFEEETHSPLYVQLPPWESGGNGRTTPPPMSTPIQSTAAKPSVTSVPHSPPDASSSGRTVVPVPVAISVLPAPLQMWHFYTGLHMWIQSMYPSSLGVKAGRS